MNLSMEYEIPDFLLAAPEIFMLTMVSVILIVDLFLPVRFYWVRRARWLKLQREGRLAHPVAPAPSQL